MKKILSLVLAMLMIFSVVPAVFAADAKAEDAHQEALDFLSLIGLYKGGVDASEKLTRWQMALFVSRFITGKLDDAYWATTENDSGFADVNEFLDKDMKYVVGAVSFAAQQGIITGYGDGKFGPNDGITYRDALVMVVRALGTTYGTAGYPWSYVKTAGDWGLTAGLESVSHMDQLTRAQVAQILYNALFVEIEGETVAEEIFGVAEDVVIITASNDVQLNEENALVARTGFVQFAVADAEGAPSGTKYHVDAKALGIADANAAVGEAFKVTHMNNFANILSSESLKVEYKNYAGDNQIALGSGQITLDGVKTYMVSKWTTLNNQQGTNHAADLYESKVYASIGSAQDLGTMGKDYYMDEKGYIYAIDTLTLVAYYSDFFKTMYSATVTAHGIVEFGTLADATKNAIVADLTLGGGQYTLTTSAFDSAYAKAEAFDVDGNGVYDRVNLRNYQFGTITMSSNLQSFTLTTGVYNPNFTDTNMPSEAGLNELKAVGGTYYTSNHSASVTANTDYRFTGVALSEFAKSQTYYILYYVDPVNYEIDILEVIGQKGKVNAADDKSSYVARGYVLGFHQTNNLIYINDGVDKIKTLTLGYKDMLGAPIVEFQATNKTAYQNYNDALIALMLEAREEQYIEYVVVNGKLVYIDDTYAVNANDDVVVIDYFTTISEEGIEAYAWSTATNSYEIIKIAEFNGWNVGGFDWRDYYFSSFFGGTTPNLESLLPVKAGEIYRVVYNNGNVYNLAIATPNANIDVIEVANGYIHTGKLDATTGTYTATKYTATTANDYWVIRETDANGKVLKVYTRSGKMAQVTLEDIDVYQLAKDTCDYVISGTSAALADLKDAIFYDGNIKLMYYKELVGFYDQDWMYDNLGNYFYGHYMMDVLTNEPTFIKYDVTSAAAAARVRAAVEDNGDGAIYIVIDDVLYEANANDPQTMEEVKDHYVTAKVYKDVDTTVALSIPAFDGAAIVANARNAVEETLGYKYWATQDYISYKNITVIGVADDKYVRIAGADYSTEAKLVEALDASAFDDLQDVKEIILYPMYDAAGNIIVLVKASTPITGTATTTVDARAASIGQDYLKRHTYVDGSAKPACTNVDATLTGFTSMDTLVAQWNSVTTIDAANAHTHEPLTTAAKQNYKHLTNTATVEYEYDEDAKTLTLDITYDLDRWINDLKFTKLDGTTVVAYDNTVPHGVAKNDGVDGTLWGASRNTKTLHFEFSNIAQLEDMIFWVCSTGTDSCVTVKLTLDLTK